MISKEKIKLSDINPEPYFLPPGSEGTHGKRFYGQKDVPGIASMCRTTLWESKNHQPSKYLGTYVVEKRDRKNQDLSHFFPSPETSITVQATKVEDDLALKNWVLRWYIWIPAGAILSLGVAALIATLIWV